MGRADACRCNIEMTAPHPIASINRHRPFDVGDEDLLHLQHGLHGAIGLLAIRPFLRERYLPSFSIFFISSSFIALTFGSWSVAPVV
jgi:hypothetical protein